MVNLWPPAFCCLRHNIIQHYIYLKHFPVVYKATVLTLTIVLQEVHIELYDIYF